MRRGSAESGEFDTEAAVFRGEAGGAGGVVREIAGMDLDSRDAFGRPVRRDSLGSAFSRWVYWNLSYN